MKKSSIEAAKSLGLHPTNLMLHLVSLGCTLEDAWPEIEEAWIETVRATDWDQFGHKAPAATDTTASVQEPTALPVSEKAALVIEKLWRNDRWGKAYVGIEGMQKHTHLHSQELETIAKELSKKGLLLQQAKTGTYSLNPAKRSEIENIAKVMVSRKEP